MVQMFPEKLTVSVLNYFTCLTSESSKFVGPTAFIINCPTPMIDDFFAGSLIVGVTQQTCDCDCVPPIQLRTLYENVK